MRLWFSFTPPPPTHVECCTYMLCNNLRCPGTMLIHQSSAEQRKTFHLYPPPKHGSADRLSIIRASLSLNAEQHFSFEQPLSKQGLSRSTTHTISVLFRWQLVLTKLFHSFIQSVFSIDAFCLSRPGGRCWKCVCARTGGVAARPSSSSR